MTSNPEDPEYTMYRCGVHPDQIETSRRKLEDEVYKLRGDCAITTTKPSCGSIFECAIPQKHYDAFFVYRCGNCMACINIRNPSQFPLRELKPSEKSVLKSTVPVSREVPYSRSFPSAMKQEETEEEPVERRRFDYDPRSKPDKTTFEILEKRNQQSSKNEKCSLKYPCLGRAGVHCSRKKPCQKHF